MRQNRNKTKKKHKEELLNAIITCQRIEIGQKEKSNKVVIIHVLSKHNYDIYDKKR